jgi:DNA-binding NtrC family response regulator
MACCAKEGRSGQHPGVTLYTVDGNVRTLRAIEVEIISLAVGQYGGSVSKAAFYLKIGRSTLYRKIDGSQGERRDSF